MPTHKASQSSYNSPSKAALDLSVEAFIMNPGTS